jgi:AmiR/NasT family two-component response regulator
VSVFLDESMADHLEHLGIAGASVTVVQEATGLLAGTQGCSAEQAKGLIRQAADHEARTILEIAQRIIEQHDTR